jgi:hypothetical protein
VAISRQSFCGFLAPWVGARPLSAKAFSRPGWGPGLFATEASRLDGGASQGLAEALQGRATGQVPSLRFSRLTPPGPRFAAWLQASGRWPEAGPAPAPRSPCCRGSLRPRRVSRRPVSQTFALRRRHLLASQCDWPRASGGRPEAARGTHVHGRRQRVAGRRHRLPGGGAQGAPSRWEAPAGQLVAGARLQLPGGARRLTVPRPPLIGGCRGVDQHERVALLLPPLIGGCQGVDLP